jgi:hypothetical protein
VLPKVAPRSLIAPYSAVDALPFSTYSVTMTLAFEPSEYKYKLQGLGERIEVLRGFL